VKRVSIKRIVSAFYFLIFLLFSKVNFPQTPEELIEHGDKFHKEFNHTEALKFYLEADELSPSNWEILWRISRAYLDIGRKMPENSDEENDAKLGTFKKSFDYADSSVKLAADQSIPYIRRAMANGNIALFEGVFSAIGTVESVKEDCERAIQLDNGGNYYQSLAHYVLAKTHVKVCEKTYLLRLPLGLGWGDMDEAIREFTIAIKLQPNLRMYYLDLAKAYIEEDEYELAKENLLMVEKAPFSLEDDDEYLDEARELMVLVNEELE
jgi:tetratricopeptide (TPR) repeat protein